MRRLLTGACAVVLALILSACNGAGSLQGSQAQAPDGWPTSGLATELPVPSGTVNSVDYDDESLRAELGEYDVDAYNEYVSACEDAGFTVDAEKESNSYIAYSEEGHRLYLSYWDSEETLDIEINAPMEMTEISWPTIGAGSLAPAPQSTTGVISSESSDYFYAYVGDTDRDAYADYVDACIDAGFNIDYDKGDDWYYADDKNGNHISLKYIGFNIITVNVDASEGTAEAVAEDASDDSTSATEVSAEFKETMDSYEAFFNEYVEFMKAYSDNPSDPNVLSEYADIMAKYSETMDAMSSVDTGSLSSADYAYYAEVTGRIYANLATIA